MAKKGQFKKTPPTRTTRRFPILLGLLLFVLGGWWIWHSDYFSSWKDRFLHYVDNRDIATLESRFSPEQIIESHHQEILGSEKGDKRSLKNTSLIYFPYLLLDVKYVADGKSREGVLLWGLNDGEIVMNTDTWESTHGFRDCLECHANRNDLKILYALSKQQGGMPVEELQKELKVEREVLNSWIEEAKQKHLVVLKGNYLQLHFEDPKLVVIPQTRIKHPIVSIPQGTNQKGTRNYTRSQIITLAKAGFGNEFKIRNEEEIYLPVYRFELLNADGSIQFSEWNALTGKRIIPNYLKKSN